MAKKQISSKLLSNSNGGFLNPEVVKILIIDNKRKKMKKNCKFCQKMPNL